MCTYKGFSVCYKTFLSLLKVVLNNTYFRHQYDFSLNVFLMWLILILKNTYYQWIEIEKYREYKFYDNMEDLSIRYFWYYRNDTKISPCVMLCSLFPIKDSSGYLHTTVYLTGMLQASWHTAEGNSESKDSYIKSWSIAKLHDTNIS